MSGRTRALLALVVAVAGCATTAPGSNAQCEWNVCVEWRDTRSGRVYSVRNGSPVPATVRFEARFLRNLRVAHRLPIERVVPARSTMTLATLETVVRDAPTGVEAAVSIDLGASDTEPDDYLYGMPFGGDEPRPLVQGFNGNDTHLFGMRYALDFGMPEGTPVLASRPGIVVHVQDGFTEGGTDPDLLERVNLVVVGHTDGTLGFYGHLAPGIRVSPGEAVLEGKVLGRSGATGFAGQPHLHFHVGLRALGEPGRTIRVRLKDGAGREAPSEVGRYYQPAAALPDE